MKLGYGETLIFYNRKEDEGENAFGVVKLYVFESFLLFMNYIGGDFPRVIDLTRAVEKDGNEQDIIESGLGEYIHDVVLSKPRDCVYLPDIEDDENRPKCSCGCSTFSAEQECWRDVTVNGSNKILDAGLLDTSIKPTGPFTCMKCCVLYDELDELEGNGDDE